MKEYFPNEWEDEERMNVLMSAMPSLKESVSCQSRFNFWSSTIHKWTEANKFFSFTFRESELAFQRGSQVPLCLADVLLFMQKKGELVTMEQLLNNSNNTWLEWTKKNFLTQPSQWAWKLLKQQFSYGSDVSSVYVNISHLKKVADNFLNEYWSQMENKNSHITSMSRLHPILLKFVSKTGDHNLLLQHLSVLGKVCHTVIEGELIVKFGSPGEIEVLPISEIEIAEYRLTSVQKTLEERMKALLSEINSCREEAKSLIKLGLKKQAYTKLRRKQILEKTFDSVTSSHENVAGCIDKLRESEINREVVGAFHSGLNALKNSITNSKSTESIEDTLDNLKEVLDECNDIAGIISSTVDSQDISEDDLEKELISLMEKTSLQPVEIFPEASLPSPPSLATNRATVTGE